MRLGRLDSSDGGAAGRIPSDDAPVSEIVAFMKQLGAKPGGFKNYGVGFRVTHETLSVSSSAVVAFCPYMLMLSILVSRVKPSRCRDAAQHRQLNGQHTT